MLEIRMLYNIHAVLPSPSHSVINGFKSGLLGPYRWFDEFLTKHFSSYVNCIVRVNNLRRVFVRVG